MQRRVAAIYFVFFLVLGAGAYSAISVAEAPHVDIQGETYSQGDTFTVNGEQFTVSKLGTETSGGHGSTTTSYVGQLSSVNESYRYTAELANNSTVSYRGGTYRVAIPNGSDENVTHFTLREEFNVTQLLREDPDVENQLYTAENGTKFVRYANGTTQKLDAYLPDPQTYRFNEGEEFPYQGNETTVLKVESEKALLAWRAPKEVTRDLSEGTNITLAGQQYFPHFKGHGDDVKVVIAPTQAAYPEYQNQLQKIDYYHERINGLWGIVILSGIAATLIISMAYMPVKS